MKKLIKTIAALSAAVTLAFPTNLTAKAYLVHKSTFTNPMVNRNTNPEKGQRWKFLSDQKNLPQLGSTFLDQMGNYTYYATVDTNGKEYGNTDVFAVLCPNVARTSLISNSWTRNYVDTISVKSKAGRYYAVIMEYEDTPSNSTTDYGLRMAGGYYLQSIINNLYIEKSYNINYDAIKKNDGYTGNIYLNNRYIAGMRLTSEDPYTTFDRPVLEKMPNGKGFRTKITYHISNPAKNPPSNYTSSSGYCNIDVLKNIRVTCNGSDKSNNFISNYNRYLSEQKVTIKVPVSDLRR